MDARKRQSPTRQRTRGGSDRVNQHAQHTVTIPLPGSGYAWLRHQDRMIELSLDVVLDQVRRFRDDPQLAADFVALHRVEHAKRSARGRWTGVIARRLGEREGRHA